MQIFIPYADVAKTMKCLDWKRLGKQRVEAKQLIDAILGRTEKDRWAHHPIGKMWESYTELLKFYFNACVEEWKERGYVNNMPLEVVDTTKIVYPPWWGDEELHGSHRANLIRKDKDFYGKYGWNEKPRNGYLWIYEGKRVLVDNDARELERKRKREEREEKNSKKKSKKKESVTKKAKTIQSTKTTKSTVILKKTSKKIKTKVLSLRRKVKKESSKD